MLDLLDGICPHPDLVAAVHPTPYLVTVVAAMCGWLPDAEDRHLRPVVPA
jgi:hypothetical protein